MWCEYYKIYFFLTPILHAKSVNLKNTIYYTTTKNIPIEINWNTTIIADRAESSEE